jgi:hypothetical protein
MVQVDVRLKEGLFIQFDSGDVHFAQALLEFPLHFVGRPRPQIASGQCLQLPSHIKNHPHLFGREIPDEGAAPCGRHDQSVTLQAEHGFPHRPAAAAQLARDIVLDQPLPRLQVSLDDSFLDVALDFMTRRELRLLTRRSRHSSPGLGSLAHKQSR